MIAAMMAMSAGVASAQSLGLSTVTETQLGVRAGSYRYEESYKGGTLMTNVADSGKWGIDAIRSINLENHWFARLEGSLDVGSVSYEGSGTIKGIPESSIDLRALLGSDLRESGRAMWAPFLGVGYRRLDSDMRGVSSTGASGYRRRSEYIYIPVGAAWRRLVEEGRWSVVGEVDFLGSGMQTSWLSDVSASYNDPKNPQSSGIGYRISVEREIGDWAIGVWWRRWDIQDSQVVDWTQNGSKIGTVIEPANKTTEAGVSFKWRWR